MSRIFPALYKEELARSTRHTDKEYDDFEFEVKISEVNKFLTIFYPVIEIADNTKISGKFNSKNWDFQIKLKSDYLIYDDIRFNKQLGGGFLNDSGCYPISASRMIFDEEPLSIFYHNYYYILLFQRLKQCIFHLHI